MNVSFYANFERLIKLNWNFDPDNFYYCSDFRYESNGVFVLGVFFFLS